jgi:hypothetical protein
MTCKDTDYKCLWCDKNPAPGPLHLCFECQQWYEQKAIGMPAEGRYSQADAHDRWMKRLEERTAS